MIRKAFTIAIVCVLSLTLCLEDSFAQRRSSGRSSFGSSRSSGTSKPKYGSGSSSNTTKPKYGSGSSSSTAKPKYGSGSGSSSSTAKPKYGSGNSSSTAKPKYGSGTGTSSKPSTSSGSSTSKQQAAAKQQSQRTYQKTTKATAPPKSSYTSSSGKTVKVNKDSKAVQSIRSRPSTDYTPAARTQRTEVHITSYGYSHPYSYYHSYQPYYMGGGYSSAYWWMMMEWDASRRARWLYNNQSNIEAAAYKEGMQDAAVAAEIARLQAEGASADPNYVDPEFADNPDLMYEQEYVEAAYNPTVVKPAGGGATLLLWVILISGLLCGAYYVTFRMRFGT